MIPEAELKAFDIRNSTPEDHPLVVSVMKDWWGGRDLAYALPRLFFDHFNNSSFVVFHQHQLIAFLVGFLSQSQKNEGYIHFAGVHPSFRKRGLASYLYHLFYAYCRHNGRNVIKACTSPVNKGSIQYHIRMGFEIMPGDAVVDGVDVMRNYNRPDDPKVLFLKRL